MNDKIKNNIATVAEKIVSETASQLGIKKLAERASDTAIAAFTIMIVAAHITGKKWNLK